MELHISWKTTGDSRQESEHLSIYGFEPSLRELGEHILRWRSMLNIDPSAHCPFAAKGKQSSDLIVSHSFSDSKGVNFIICVCIYYIFIIQ